VDRAIAALTGELDQEPPVYSAKQVGGQRAYAVARRGAPVKLPASRVTVHSWEVKARSNDTLDAVITCSGGTYVRALARDLGRHAGSAAHLAALRRTGSGPFHVREACGLDALREGRCTLMAPLRALTSLAVERLDAVGADRAARGSLVDATVSGNRAALLGPNGELIAVAERSGSSWQPRTVLRDG
jgi:tRNA pseudouridine55 synthase